MNSEIERYLFVEMTDQQRETFEEKMFADDDLFVEVADAENLLVDEYVTGNLSATDAKRFERSLDLLPSVREKLANARSLSEFIDESRPTPVAFTATKPSFLEKVSALFATRLPAFGMAGATLVVLLMISTGVLLVRDRERQSDVAKLTDLQSQLEESRLREQELRSAVDAEREAGGDFVDELDRERERRERIERELEQLRQRPAQLSDTPVVASLFLSPLGGRGGQGGSIPTIKIGANTKRVALRLALPEEIDEGERLTVSLNQRRVASGLKPRVVSGKKTLSLTLDAKSVRAGTNQLDVVDSENRSVDTYSFGTIQR